MTVLSDLSLAAMRSGTGQVSVAEVLQSLARAGTLIAQSHLHTFSLSLDAMGNIELPDVTPGSADDQAQLRSIAPLYLASQLEKASLVSTVENLSGLGMTGGLWIDLGQATELLTAFWRNRNERFSEQERLGFFARLFGTDENGPRALGSQTANPDFENLMIDLCESIYKVDQSVPGFIPSPEAVARIAPSALSLVENLMGRANGMTAFASREILLTIQTSIHILQELAKHHILGARTVWEVIRIANERYFNRELNVNSYLQRGKSGLIVLSWVGDNLLHLTDSSRALLTSADPVTAAAMEWLQSSLEVHEKGIPALEGGH